MTLQLRKQAETSLDNSMSIASLQENLVDKVVVGLLFRLLSFYGCCSYLLLERRQGERRNSSL